MAQSSSTRRFVALSLIPPEHELDSDQIDALARRTGTSILIGHSNGHRFVTTALEHAEDFLEALEKHLLRRCSEPADGASSVQIEASHTRAPNALDERGASDSMAPSPGQILGARYRIVSKLGSGGTGEVWEAYDLKLRTPIALKMMRRDRYLDDGFLETLRSEVRTARCVVSPNVCRVFDLVSADGLELISMEFIDGSTLRNLLEHRGPLDLREAHTIADQLLAGLEAIHQAQLVHRDIKPENIMVTRTGRVAIMDFGIANYLRDKEEATCAGTPAYVAPEQNNGDGCDARADVYSTAIVVAELLFRGARDRAALEELWRGVRENPPRIPDSPWKSVLAAAVAAEPRNRTASASALRSALQEVTLRVDDAERCFPYPGLTAFTKQDAEFFFGREAEIEQLWMRLRSAQLLALIGPSGVGKTSFLQAGIVPTMPEGWCHVLVRPGQQPFVSLLHAIADALEGDPEFEGNVERSEEPEVALKLFQSWRQRHGEALLIIDQFEELFTLNSNETQIEFARLVGAIAIDADVRVLLSMRDDFLMRCHDHPELAPITSELTLLGTPAGPALRRAIVQPALRCGYRFEDARIIHALLDAVADERGVMPLLAFTAASMWNRRDREQGLLTCNSYDLIGGVSGALAQHAEATLERIGMDRLPFVREIFRNLVTASGTRATRALHEVLSAFEDTETAMDVVDQLIDARLINSFDASDGLGQDTRIEIVHESLLKTWPRLERWQRQNSEGAQLRELLRSASRMWADRGYPTDLLWTGTAYREFQLWREHYPDRLSVSEEEFVKAMSRHATRRRRVRQRTAFAIFAALLVALTSITTLWYRSEIAARRAEARSLLSLAESEADQNRSACLAYAIKSLELEDTPSTRRFVVDLLWKGPTALLLPGDDYSSADFSPDGQWLATGRPFDGPTEIWSRNGGPPRSGAFGKLFGASSDHMLRTWNTDSESLTVVSAANASIISTLHFDGVTAFDLSANRRYVVSRTDPDAHTWTEIHAPSLLRVWSLRAFPPRQVGKRLVDARALFGAISLQLADVDDSGRWLAYARDKGIEIVAIDSMETADASEIGRHAREVVGLAFHPDGNHLASVDDGGAVRIWSVDAGSSLSAWNKRTVGRVMGPLRFDRSGRWLAAPDNSLSGLIWDLHGPPAQDPIRLHTLPGRKYMVLAMHPEGRWVAAGSGGRIAIWPLAQSHSYVLRGHLDAVNSLKFDPEGEWLASASHDGTLRLWSLSGSSDYAMRTLYESANIPMSNLHVDPLNRDLLASRWSRWLSVDVNTGAVQELESLPKLQSLGQAGRQRRGDGSLAISMNGRLIAVEVRNPDTNTIVQIEERSGRTVASFDVGHSGRAINLRFLLDGRLLGYTGGEIRAWNPQDGTSSVLFDKEEAGYFDVTPDGRWLVSVRPDHAFLYDRHNGLKRYLPEFKMSDWSFPVIDPNGSFAAVAFPDGVIRVLPLTGGPAHLLSGHRGEVLALAIDPQRRWIASAGVDQTIRVWPVPDGVPLHTQPRHELLRRLRRLTNMRAVRAEESESGYRIEHAEFPGWAHLPTW